MGTHHTWSLRWTPGLQACRPGVVFSFCLYFCLSIYILSPFAGMILVQALSHHLTFKLVPLWFLLLLFSRLVTSLFACQHIFLDSCSKPLIIAKNTCYSQCDETGSMITKFSYGKINIICQRPNLIARKPSKINAKQLTMANKRVL